MRKKVGILKRMSCLLLIFLLSINSFAAIVSDNDGSAFITKAEFDALKSSFQSQIDSYNQSIDSKIDGAIASYLAGIKLAQEGEYDDIYSRYSINGFPLTWSSSTTGTQASSSKQVYWRSRHFATVSNQAQTWSRWSLKTLDGSSTYQKKWIKPGAVTDGFLWGKARVFFETADCTAIKSSNPATGGSGAMWAAFTATSFIQNTYALSTGYASGDHMVFWGAAQTQTQDDTTYNPILYPLSTANDYYVDLIDTTSKLGIPSSGTTAATVQWGAGTTDSDDVWAQVTDNVSWSYTKPIQAPWLAKTIAEYNLRFKDLKTVAPENEQIRYGVYIGKTDKKANLTITGKATKDGKIKIGCGTSASGAWSASGLQNEVDCTASVTWSNQLNNVPKDFLIFLIYLPTSTSDNGTLSDIKIRWTSVD